MSANHYQTLGVSPQANSQEIKAAYRDLAKRCHPDVSPENQHHGDIVQINGAYEVLRDPEKRRHYDQSLRSGGNYQHQCDRQQRTAQAQAQYYQRRGARGRQEDHQRELWLRDVYGPICSLLDKILNPLQGQLDELAGDPFDDVLMDGFLDYLEQCRHWLHQAEIFIRSCPNPPKLAAIAANLYHCLNQLNDAIEQFTWFSQNYDDYYLHTGLELVRIARGLHGEIENSL